MLSAIAERAAVVQADKVQGMKLRVVPILGPSHDQPPYELLRPEILGQVSISEISESGSVPTLLVKNDMDVRVFLMDGQELIGAKQNRILNTDVLVPAGASIRIPVSCVEQGRWHSVSPSFSPGKAASHRTRSGKLGRVHESLKMNLVHDANQHEVWNEVEMSLRACDAGDSHTRALADAYSKRQREMDQFRSTLKLPDRAVGVAVFHGEQFQGLDLFDRHTTMQMFWDSLVDSYAVDFLDAPVDVTEPAAAVEDSRIRELLNAAASGNWECFDSPGEGKDWRLETADLNGSALLWEDKVVLHLQLFPRQRPMRVNIRPGRIHRPYRATRE